MDQAGDESGDYGDEDWSSPTSKPQAVAAPSKSKWESHDNNLAAELEAELGLSKPAASSYALADDGYEESFDDYEDEFTL